MAKSRADGRPRGRLTGPVHPASLEANRRGRLTAGQRLLLACRALQLLGSAVLVVAVVVDLAIEVARSRQDLVAKLAVAVILAIFPVLSLLWCVAGVRTAAAAAGGRCASAIGVVQWTRREARTSVAVETLRVGGVDIRQRFWFPAMARIPGGERWQVWYAAAGGALFVNAEPAGDE